MALAKMFDGAVEAATSKGHGERERERWAQYFTMLHIICAIVEAVWRLAGQKKMLFLVVSLFFSSRPFHFHVLFRFLFLLIVFSQFF